MANLVNLPGVLSGRISDVPMERSVSGALKALVSHRAVTGAGDHGAWTVWRDDVGAYRCKFSRYMMTVNEAVFGTKAQVKSWLEKWIPIANGAES